MTAEAPGGARPPYAAYGPAAAGYGPIAVAPAPIDGRGAPAGPTHPPHGPGGPLPHRGAPLPPPPPTRHGLGVTALVLAIFGVLFALIPFTGGLAWFFLVVAAILGIVQVCRRGAPRGMAVVSLVLFAVGAVAAGAWTVAMNDSGSDVSATAPADDPYTQAQNLVIQGDARPSSLSDSAPALPWGTAVVVSDRRTGEPVWSVTAGEPVDVTTEALSSDASSSASGSVMAAPLTLTNLTGSSIDTEAWQFRFSVDLVAPDGTALDPAYFRGVSTAYPDRWDLTESIAPGATVTVWNVVDAPASVVQRSSTRLFLYSGDEASWATLPASAG